ncbi:MAG: ion channel [Bacillaceae bacterium]
MVYGLIALIAFLIVYKSIAMLARVTSHQHSFSSGSLILLCLIYVTIMVAFGLWYVILELNNMPVLIGGQLKDQSSFFSILENCMYFSAVTLFSVGYGDVIPVGIGKWLVIVEALIGYTMPAAFIVHTIRYPKSK